MGIIRKIIAAIKAPLETPEPDEFDKRVRASLDAISEEYGEYVLHHHPSGSAIAIADLLARVKRLESICNSRFAN